MIVRRFHAASTREALRDVRDALGADALILSNRRLPSGDVELVAMIESGVAPAVLPAPFAARQAPDAAPRSAAISAYTRVSQGDDTGEPGDWQAQAQRGAAGAERPQDLRAGAQSASASGQGPAPASAQRQPPPPAHERHPDAALPDARAPAPWPPAQQARLSPGEVRARLAEGEGAGAHRTEAPDPPAGDVQAGPADAGAMTEIAAEVRSLRSLVEQQLAGFAWGDRARRSPVETEVMRRLLAAGFSTLLARELAGTVAHLGQAGAEGGDAIPASDTQTAVVGAGAPATLVDTAWRQVRALLFDRLNTLLEPVDPCEQGGVFALVGPTGVGKTTTVAKLAARCVLARGASSAALLTTDGFRIGALDQLRIYGRILGVPVIAVRDESELQMTLGDLAARHLTLIDTVGMSQRDRRLAEQAALLSGEGRAVRRVLLLSAAASGSTLEDVATRYAGAGLDGCILTKIDEAVSLGGVLDVVLRHRLRVYFVANGQRVPEDLHLPNLLYLIDRALRGREASNPFTPASDEFALVAASGGSGA